MHSGLPPPRSLRPELSAPFLCCLPRPVNLAVAIGAEGNQVFFTVGSASPAEDEMVDVQIATAAAQLAPPPIAAKDFLP